LSGWEKIPPLFYVHLQVEHPMYEAISSDYDRFVNWPARLAAEMPFIDRQIQETAGRGSRVIDAACGTGMHAIALAQLGYQLSAADASHGMIERANHNASTAGVSIHFETAGFGHLAGAFKRSSFDALLCLGNSLPHLLSASALAACLADFKTCLRPRGLLLLQNRNFDAVLARRERWMEPQAYRKGESEWLFLRFYDFDPDDLLSFHMVILHREGTASWTQQITTTRLKPLRQDELVQALRDTGYAGITSYGGMATEPFDPEKSANLVITAISP
jgi:glycine/sarcosine N-methyltransferase